MSDLFSSRTYTLPSDLFLFGAIRRDVAGFLGRPLYSEELVDPFFPFDLPKHRPSSFFAITASNISALFSLFLSYDSDPVWLLSLFFLPDTFFLLSRSL